VTLQGNLKDFSTSQLLNLINLAQKSGTLTIFANVPDSPEELGQPAITSSTSLKRARIVFQEGKPVLSMVEVRDLVALLRRTGKLSPMQAHWIQNRLKDANEKAQALLLIEGDFVTKADIVEAFTEQLKDDIHTVLMWTDGSFLFEEQTPTLDDHITVSVDLGDVLVEHGSHVREVLRMTQELPNLSATLRFTPDVDERLQHTRLSARAWRVISSIKPGVSIRQIARQNQMDAMEVRRVVISLLQAGVVELGDPAQESEMDISPQGDSAFESIDPSIFDTLIEGIQTAAEHLIDPASMQDNGPSA